MRKCWGGREGGGQGGGARAGQGRHFVSPEVVHVQDCGYGYALECGARGPMEDPSRYRSYELANDKKLSRMPLSCHFITNGAPPPWKPLTSENEVDRKFGVAAGWSVRVLQLRHQDHDIIRP